MFKELLFPLVRVFTPFNIFQYITFRAAYSAVTALLICFLVGPRLIRYLQQARIGEAIRDDGPKSHLIKSGTPTMGGILMTPAIVISAILWMDIRASYTWIAVFALLGFGAIGLVDDLIKTWRPASQGLPGWLKLICQTIVAAIVVMALYILRTDQTTLLYVPFLKEALVDLSVFYIPFAILLLVATTNSVNLTDGLDGLAAGLVIMVGITFAVLSYIGGRIDFADYLQIPFVHPAGELAILCFALIGACVGFLWFNAHPCELMMGDTGSLSLGGVIGVIALMIKKEVLLLVVGGVFVIEAASVILQVVSYKLFGKRLFLMAPVHHHFELLGWHESKVVIRFWILGGIFSILSLSTLKIQ